MSEYLIERHAPIQDCDCQACAVFERDRLSKKLESAIENLEAISGTELCDAYTIKARIKTMAFLARETLNDIKC
jgi:hypothetical protein